MNYKEEQKQNYLCLKEKAASGIVLLMAAVFVVGAMFAHAQSAFAQNAVPGGVQTTQELGASLGANEEFRQATGLSGTDIRIIIAKIIRAALGLVGIVMIGFILYAGYLWMTSGGDEEKIITAKNMLKNLVIGLAIILTSVAIVQFVIQKLTGEGGGAGGAPEAAGGGAVFFEGHAQLGIIIESHYPERNAQDVPRNTMIAVTFKEKIKQDTIIADANAHTLNSTNVKIFRTFGPDGKTPNKEDAALKNEQVKAEMDASHKIFVFKPVEYLGDPNQNVEYTVVLKAGIKIDDGSKDGKSAFLGANNQYDWHFSVSPKVDLTPPRVVTVFPYPSKDKNDKQPRNVLAQITFNEPVDPLSASGKLEKGIFENVTFAQGSAYVPGEWKVSNGYRTIEFVPSEQCGENSCGMPVYCLPGQAVLSVTAKAASLEQAGISTAKLPSDGVIDMAANSLDGGGEFKYDPAKKDFVFPAANNKAEGPPSDNFVWNFNTSNQKDTISPKITSIYPAVNGQNIKQDAPIEAMFTKIMSPATFENINVKASKADKYVWIDKRIANYDAQGVDTAAQKPDGTPLSSNPPAASKMLIKHGQFWRDPPPPVLQLNVSYSPFIPSTVTDIYQNCFYTSAGPGAEAGKECAVSNVSPSCFNGTPKPYLSAQNCEKDNGKGQKVFDADSEGCKELKIEFPPSL